MRIRFHHRDMDNVLLDLIGLKVLEHLLDGSSGMGQAIRRLGVLGIWLPGTVKRPLERTGGDVSDTGVETHIILILGSTSEHTITLEAIANGSALAPADLMMHTSHVEKHQVFVCLL